MQSMQRMLANTFEELASESINGTTTTAASPVQVNTEDDTTKLRQFVVSALKQSKSVLSLVEIEDKIRAGYSKTLKEITGMKSKKFFKEMEHEGSITMTFSNCGSYLLCLSSQGSDNRNCNASNNAMQTQQIAPVKASSDRSKNSQITTNTTAAASPVPVNAEADTSELRQFVVSTLKQSDTHSLSLADIEDKIRAEHAKTLKEITGLKSKKFFKEMEQEGSITMKKNGGSFLLSLSSQGSDDSDDSDDTNNRNRNHGMQTQQIAPTNASSEQGESKSSQIATTTKPQTQGPSDADTVARATTKEIVRLAILRDFVSLRRDRINLCAVKSYCKKYALVDWNKVIPQSPTQFMAAMEEDKLVVVHREKKKDGKWYPYMTLNADHPEMKTFTVQSLNDKINALMLELKKELGNAQLQASLSKTTKVEKEGRSKLKSQKRKLPAATPAQVKQINGSSSEPATKKQKTEAEKEKRLDIPIHANSKQNASRIAHQLINELAALQDKHDIHFHFYSNSDIDEQSK